MIALILKKYPEWKYKYREDWEWLEKVKSHEIDYQKFMLEYAFVILNSGFRASTIAAIWKKFIVCFYGFDPYVRPQDWQIDKALGIFGNVKKVGAIEKTGRNLRGDKFEEWWSSIYSDKDKALAAFEELPWIGPITKYHLARNLGIDCFKPDRWVVRAAQACEMSPEDFFKYLHEQTGDPIGVIDLIVWRACEQGELNLTVV